MLMDYTKLNRGCRMKRVVAVLAILALMFTSMPAFAASQPLTWTGKSSKKCPILDKALKSTNTLYAWLARMGKKTTSTKEYKTKTKKYRTK